MQKAWGALGGKTPLRLLETLLSAEQKNLKSIGHGGEMKEETIPYNSLEEAKYDGL